MELQNVVVSLKEGGHVQVSVHAVPFIILCNDFDRKAALVHIIGSVLPILINKERINVVMNPVANTVITIMSIRTGYNRIIGQKNPAVGGLVYAGGFTPTDKASSGCIVFAFCIELEVCGASCSLEILCLVLAAMGDRAASG